LKALEICGATRSTPRKWKSKTFFTASPRPPICWEMTRSSHGQIFSGLSSKKHFFASGPAQLKTRDNAEIQNLPHGVFGEITNLASSGSSKITSSFPLSPSTFKAVLVARIQHAALQIFQALRRTSLKIALFELAFIDALRQFGIFFVRDRARRAVNLFPFLSNKTLGRVIPQSAKFVCDLVVAQQDWIVHLQLLAIYFRSASFVRKAQQPLSIVVHGNSENRKSLWAVFRLQLDNSGISMCKAPQKNHVAQKMTSTTLPLYSATVKSLRPSPLWRPELDRPPRSHLCLQPAPNDREKRHN